MKDDGHTKGMPPGVQSASSTGSDTLPIDIAGIIGGRARRVPDAAGRAADSMLAIYKQRLTYTFICENEVASIHYDAMRHEIFFRGHNIKYMALSETQSHALWALVGVLERDREGQKLQQSYHETLAQLLSDTK